tara:strand:+ start:1341 stop:1727 length:387 start_codon:yes stop_codon:yes gene_type:complete
MSSIEISFVIASSYPKELAEFYAHFNEVEIHKGIDSDHYLLSLRNVLTIQIYRPSAKQSCPKGGRTIALCFQSNPSTDPIAKIKRWSSEITQIGGSIVSTPNKKSFGAELWLSDPDGNNFLIFAPSIS